MNCPQAFPPTAFPSVHTVGGGGGAVTFSLFSLSCLLFHKLPFCVEILRLSLL